jgi:hypothetical protein
MLTVVPVLTMACEVSYGLNDEVTVYDVIENLGDESDCNISLYRNNTLIINTLMNRHGLAYDYQFGELAGGDYVANIECNKTVNVTTSNLFLGQCKFVVEEEDDNMSIAIIVGVLGFTALLLYISFRLEQSHVFLKILIIFVAVFLQLITGSMVVAITEGTSLADAGLSFYVAIVWFIRIFVVYAFVYLVYHSLNYFRWRRQNRYGQ